MGNKYPNPDKQPQPNIPFQVPQYSVIPYGSQWAIHDSVNNEYVLGKKNQPLKFHTRIEAESYMNTLNIF